jgi:hypothetical protein
MRSGTRLLVLAFAAGCGAKTPEAPLADVKGAPLRRESPPELTRDVASLGDADLVKPAAVQPPVPEPVGNPTPAAASPADYQNVTFEELSGFDYALYASESKQTHPVPEKIRALSGKRIAVDGYMMPLVGESGGAKKFLLLKSQTGCCYGGTPKLNEWIEVTMDAGVVAKYEHFALVTVWGVLEVNPESREGMATGLYKMAGSRAEFTEAK